MRFLIALFLCCTLASAYEVNVKYHGRTYLCELGKADTVYDLKNQLNDRYDIPSEHLKVRYGEEILTDERSCHSYGLTPGCVVHAEVCKEDSCSACKDGHSFCHKVKECGRCRDGHDGRNGLQGPPGPIGPAGASCVAQPNVTAGPNCFNFICGGVFNGTLCGCNVTSSGNCSIINCGLGGTATICNGTAGLIGPSGISGVNGTNGAPGINGTNGAPGVNGTNGLNGTSCTTTNFTGPLGTCTNGGAIINCTDGTSSIICGAASGTTAVSTVLKFASGAVPGSQIAAIFSANNNSFLGFGSMGTAILSAAPVGSFPSAATAAGFSFMPPRAGVISNIVIRVEGFYSRNLTTASYDFIVTVVNTLITAPDGTTASDSGWITSTAPFSLILATATFPAPPNTLFTTAGVTVPSGSFSVTAGQLVAIQVAYTETSYADFDIISMSASMTYTYP